MAKSFAALSPIKEKYPVGFPLLLTPLVLFFKPSVWQDLVMPIVMFHVDPTGVGDAFRGGFLAGYSRGFDWKLCGEIGSLAAVYCLEQKGPQSHSYTRQEFAERIRRHFDDAGKLDGLLN